MKSKSDGAVRVHLVFKHFKDTMESDEIISLTQKRLLRWTWMLLQDQIDDLARASFFEMLEDNPDNLVPFLKEAGSISENGMRRVLYKETFFEIDKS